MMTNSSTLFSSLSAGVSIPLAVCFILIVIFGILFNAILILVILAERNLHTITNVYIINLAVGDLLTAIAVVPFDADFMLRGYYPYGTIPCGIKEVLFMFSLPSSVINLLLLTFERFVSVYFPFKRIQYFSKRNVLISISLSWIYTINVGLFPVYINGPSTIKIHEKTCYMSFSTKFAIYQISVNFFLPVLIMIGLNFSLFSIAHKHQKQIQRMSINTSRKCSNSFQSNVKAAKTILLLVGNFLVCWLSYIMIAISNLMCNGCHPRALTWVSNVVNYSNIVFNPLIYGLLNKSIRKAVFKKIYKILRFFCNAHYQNHYMKPTDSQTVSTYHSPGFNNNISLRTSLTPNGNGSFSRSQEIEATTLL